MTRFFPLASPGLYELGNAFAPLAGGGSMDPDHIRRTLAELLPLAETARLIELLDGVEDRATKRLYALAGLFEAAQRAGGATLSARDVATVRGVIEECANRLSDLELRQERPTRMSDWLVTLTAGQA